MPPLAFLRPSYIRLITAAPPDPALAQKITSLVFSAIVAKTVYVAAKLSIADELADVPLTVDELARRTNTNADALYRVLRALAVEGLFEEVGPRMFAVTELGRMISEDAPHSRRYLSLMFAEQTDPLFEHILDVVRTGEPAAEQVLGKPYFDWLAENPEAAEIFNKAMAGRASIRLPALLSLDLWKEAKSVIDIGGGNGEAVVALLEMYPHLHAVVFDLPHVRREAEAKITDAGLSDRAEFVGGSFFDSVPTDGDVYLLLQILHDWRDEDATRILHTVREAIPDDGRLVLLEFVVDEQPVAAAWLDILMLVLLGGRERTGEEWRELLAGGGFELERVTIGPGASALEARPV